MNFITLQGRNFNLNTVEEYEIIDKASIILYFVRGRVELKYNNIQEFNRDKSLLLQAITNQSSFA